ncbi:MAG: alpha/beta hydrolase [Spirochaetales bacterium]|nr:alpha/beta hydrolase [Spirochaetales bacterium]
MKFISIFTIALILSVSSCLGMAANNVKADLKGILINEETTAEGITTARFYKQTDHGKLQIHFLFPENYDSQREKPYTALVYYHGGGWVGGEMAWSHKDAGYMATLGLIGVAVQYSFANNSTSVLQAMKDANSSIRWVRSHAEEFNIDPNKIIAMGGSSGAHLALCTAFFPQFRESSEDETISSIPNGIIVIAAPVNVVDHSFFSYLLLNQEKAINCSPYHHIQSGMPPVFMIHSKMDEMVPFRHTEDFVNQMKKAGNQIELYISPGTTHVGTFDDPDANLFWQESCAQAVEELNWN